MNDLTKPSLLAGTDGGAELRLVLQLDWSDVAELGRVASTLAATLQRPVSLDEAASHQLSRRPEATRSRREVDSDKDAPVKSTPVVIPVRAAVEQPRQAIGAAGQPTGPASAAEYAAQAARHATPAPA
ncbi:hypothetical protein P3T36_007558 [Kitasatospora sp. MAP12-15]|uniref:hypothetical protein n=1 Tax=unclassified Kitasatospora TaxID=2633591 RepID=UPI0024745FB3|nr:hypothetical protein [Kitasatospora sp. MAP12-44]MDH6114644.1 hypothetical protein [Kitasatospora sp. MAP12-44]